MKKKVVVAGLGLMGGSMAMAIRKYTDCEVYGWNRTRSVAEKAAADGTLHGIADEAAIADADLMIISLYPQSTVDFLLEHMPRMKKGCIIVDLVGVKRFLQENLEHAAVDAGVHFIGGHPMAGKEFSGYAFATPELFQDASMILVPNASSPLWAVDEMDSFFMQLGFGRVVRCSAEQHDHMIAFTSQLAHVVSSAYIKSPEALRHNGYSAGSYKDLTRVAKLNEHMWTELFLRNAEPLVGEIDEIIRHLTDYRDAIAGGEEERLCALLREGRERKESIG
ncbi:MAG: prephenate dehydrogenase [Butyricicoccus pullicaecorum]|jgi:prephenate dehydrogenase|nr:prephenate dehydrogenase [Butyricicoccus pullicaecorum]